MVCGRGDEVVPPTLGLVLILTAWRYVALPAATIAMAYGFRKSLPTKVFLYDPVFVSRDKRRLRHIAYARTASHLYWVP